MSQSDGQNMPSGQSSGSNAVQLLFNSQYNAKRNQQSNNTAQPGGKGANPNSTTNSQLTTLLDSSAPITGQAGSTGVSTSMSHSAAPKPVSAIAMTMSQPAKDPYEFDDTAPTHLPTPQHASWSSSGGSAGSTSSITSSAGMSQPSTVPSSGGPTASVVVPASCGDGVKPPLKLTIRSSNVPSGGSSLESVLSDKKDKTNCIMSGPMAVQGPMATMSTHGSHGPQFSKKSKKVKAAGKPQNLADLILNPSSNISSLPSNLSSSLSSNMPMPDIPGTTVLPIGQLPPQVPPNLLKKQRKRKRESPGGSSEQSSPNSSAEKKKDRKKPGRKKKEQSLAPIAILPNMVAGGGGMMSGTGLSPGAVPQMVGTNANLAAAGGLNNQTATGEVEQKQPPIKISFHAKTKDLKVGKPPDMGMSSKLASGSKTKEKKASVGAVGTAAAGGEKQMVGNGAVTPGAANTAPPGMLLSALSKSNFKIPKKKSAGDSPGNSGGVVAASSNSNSPAVGVATASVAVSPGGGVASQNTTQASVTSPGAVRFRASNSTPGGPAGFQPKFSGSASGVPRFPNPAAAGVSGGGGGGGVGNGPRGIRPMTQGRPTSQSHSPSESPQPPSSQTPHQQQSVQQSHQQMLQQQQQQQMQQQQQRLNAGNGGGGGGGAQAMAVGQASGGGKARKGYAISMVIDKLHERRGREEAPPGQPSQAPAGGNGLGTAPDGGARMGAAAGGDNIFEKFRGSGPSDNYEVMKSTKDTPDSPTEGAESGGAGGGESGGGDSGGGGTEKMIPMIRSGEPSTE